MDSGEIAVFRARRLGLRTFQASHFITSSDSLPPFLASSFPLTLLRCSLLCNSAFLPSALPPFCQRPSLTLTAWHRCTNGQTGQSGVVAGRRAGRGAGAAGPRLVTDAPIEARSVRGTEGPWAPCGPRSRGQVGTSHVSHVRQADGARGGGKTKELGERKRADQVDQVFGGLGERDICGVNALLRLWRPLAEQRIPHVRMGLKVGTQGKQERSRT